MGKFRSKLKRHTKGKLWRKGQSAISNPKQMKNRLKAKSRFFQLNLNLTPSVLPSASNALTLETVAKHNQRLSYTMETTVNDVACGLQSFKLKDDDECMSESNIGTFKTFASNYSSCSNKSFKKLLCGFRASSDLHKEMLAILTALTEIIKENGGVESSTEYYYLLIEQIESCEKEENIFAGISLLSMGIKSVPTTILRKTFSGVSDMLLLLLRRFSDSATNSTIVKHLIGCLAVLLRAQDYVTWTYSSTNQYIDTILSYTIHSKPKIRKAAQNAVVAITEGSEFMFAQKSDLNASNCVEDNFTAVEPKVQHHPASDRVAKFVLEHLKPHQCIVLTQTTILHTLALLKNTITRLKIDDIRAVCEQLLSIMTAANIIVRTNCFQVMYSMFSMRSPNLNGHLCAKLLAALYEYQPNHNDIRLIIAWFTVLKEGHICLTSLDPSLCINLLPRLIEVCTTSLWESRYPELIVAAYNGIKELLLGCVAPACTSLMLANMYRAPITNIICLMDKVLNEPFSEATKYVILAFSTSFEICGPYFSTEFTSSLLTIANLYHTESSLRLQIEHSVTSAIKTMGPELILKTLPIISTNGIILEKSWLLPLLRQGTIGASLKFFKTDILPIASDCNKKWHKYEKEHQVANSHTYELLACQLWGLLPGFCRQPKDPENICLLAPTLGYALDNNPEYHAPIFDAFIEMLANKENKVCHEELGRFAKNFLPRLCNIYTKKPRSTYEAELRKCVLDVIKLYSTITPFSVQQELFETATCQLETAPLCTFEYDAIFDITAALLLTQSAENIRIFFEHFMVPILKNEKSKLVAKDVQKLKKQQRKTYQLLREIMTSSYQSCQKFTRKNSIDLQKLLFEAFVTSCTICQAARLNCLKIFIELPKSVHFNDKIIMKIIPEVVLNYKQLSTNKEKIAEQMIQLISNIYQEAGKINDLVDILAAGFTGDEAMITNTILVFCTVLLKQGKHLTVATLQFLLDQVAVFLVQKSRSQAEASIAFLITLIKVMPMPLVSNHLETIMRSLSTMAKDTKRYCRIHIGYLLKKLCQRFTAEELDKFVPGDDNLTHRRIKKIRKQMRRESLQKRMWDHGKFSEDSDEDINVSLEKKSITIDDILTDSDSDVTKGMDDKIDQSKERSIYIHEDPENIVDLIDIKSVGNILTNHSPLSMISQMSSRDRMKVKDINRGFKTTPEGKLIINDKTLRDLSSDDDFDDNDDIEEKSAKRTNPCKDEGSRENQEVSRPNSRKRKATNIDKSARKLNTSGYIASSRGIHRPIDSRHTGAVYSSKIAKGDIKRKGKLDPFTYIRLSRNVLNKRKRALNSRNLKSIIGGKRKSGLIRNEYKN